MKTKNIKFCAYLKMKGIHPVEVIRISRGRADYVFDISEDDWQKYQAQFHQSEFLEYANNIDAIKDLAY